MLFSATIPPPIEALARRSLHDPASIDLVGETKTVERTRHVMVEVGGGGDAARSAALARVLSAEDLEQGLVFCRTRPATDRAADDLERYGFRVAVLHGDIVQRGRDRAMRAFREGDVELLVATDVASRGLDVLGVSHVVNYHVPPTPEDYVHRVGRTARAGRAGTAMTLVAPADLYEIWRVQEGANVEMEPRPVPTDDEIAAALERRIIEKVERLLAAEAEDIPAAAAEVVDRFAGTEPRGLAIALAAALLDESRRRAPEGGGAARREDRDHEDRRGGGAGSRRRGRRRSTGSSGRWRWG
jgi:ATP-dependent RNA helicase DeaD